eukprot:TRINITY_DN43405_c0_g1_i1.p1 TRINITY_DN43405_c0_g1~~TRINITY_DN43405_c0_g1_i1.p1  ORF type:complete len:201 (+),score=33.43 TRINITY_DN43405_c0_g1_i1:82-603(+)
MAQVPSSSGSQRMVVREQPRWGRLVAAAAVSVCLAGVALSLAPASMRSSALLRTEPRPHSLSTSEVSGQTSSKPRMMRREVPTVGAAAAEKKEKPKSWGKLFRKEEAPKAGAGLPAALEDIGQTMRGASPAAFRIVGAVLSVVALACFALHAKNLLSGGLKQVRPDALKGKVV